jgi:GNAT superfamily N-acetyltransferase
MQAVRILPLADRPDLTDLVAAWGFAEWGPLNEGQTLASRGVRVREGLHRDALPMVFVAVAADGSCVGTASLMNDDLHGDTRNPWLASVYVPPEARRQGIAQHLVGAVEAEAVRQGFTTLWLYTATVPALYAGLGWQLVEDRRYRGEAITIMTKTLDAIEEKTMTDRPFASPVTLEAGGLRYRYERQWAKLPRDWSFGAKDPNAHPPRTAVKGAVAANGDVYVLSRSDHPVCVFDAEGRFVTSWGEGQFSPFVHGLAVAPDQRVWITDTGTHLVTVHLPDGTPVASLGVRDMPSPTLYGRPFNMPTNVAFAPDGDIYVSDGYGNRRVHRFGADLALKASWGEPGSGPGEFAIVHFIAISPDQRIWITDRENHRVQIFDADGAFLAEWTGFDMPSDLAIGRHHVYIGGRDGLSVRTLDGSTIAHFPAEIGAFNIHGVWIDAAENIYLAHFDKAVSKLTKLD